MTNEEEKVIQFPGIKLASDNGNFKEIKLRLPSACVDDVNLMHNEIVATLAPVFVRHHPELGPEYIKYEKKRARAQKWLTITIYCALLTFGMAIGVQLQIIAEKM